MRSSNAHRREVARHLERRFGPLLDVARADPERHFAEAAGFSIRPLQQALIADVGRWWRPLETLPRTLIHNDFNPRNIALRRTGGGLRLCAYDNAQAKRNRQQSAKRRFAVQECSIHVSPLYP